MKRIRVLIADDSLTVRKYLTEVLSAEPDFEVVAEAADGREAIEACQRLRPDVVTLDMMMPVMSGLAATEYIMAYCPTPILIVSSSGNRGEVFKTYDALAAGAVDVLEKPTGDEIASPAWESRLVDRLRLVARIKVITHPRGRHTHRGEAVPAIRLTSIPPGRGGPRLVAVGASTGGPGAVLTILQGLPQNFPLPLLVVIHLSPLFGAGFAEWLDGVSPVRVRFAKHDDPIPAPGERRVMLAPPDHHLTIADGALRLSREAERHSCRPSVDVLFESVAREFGPAAVGCLLTGMGRDGAAGLLAMKRAGAVTIAQDEGTSVVYGMPREAARLDAATRILPLEGIAPALVELTKLRS